MYSHNSDCPYNLRVTALFKLPVVTPYIAAKSASSMTFWPRISRMARSMRSAGISSSLFFPIRELSARAVIRIPHHPL
jgi:hypothetical protein